MAPPTVSSEKWKVALHLSANRKHFQGPGHPKYFKLEGSNPQVTFVHSFYTLPLSFGSQICLIWNILRAYKIFMRLAGCFLPILPGCNLSWYYYTSLPTEGAIYFLHFSCSIQTSRQIMSAPSGVKQRYCAKAPESSLLRIGLIYVAGCTPQRQFTPQVPRVHKYNPTMSLS